MLILNVYTSQILHYSNLFYNYLFEYSVYYSSEHRAENEFMLI